ncbi:MAG TPA: carboxypeptidase regulatory-like domain-containing protein [Polyangiales bacterium]|nr:carboxypeptidase regulatory-like domain-containing protein [Polyangiales bacterium]
MIPVGSGVAAGAARRSARAWSLALGSVLLSVLASVLLSAPTHAQDAEHEPAPELGIGRGALPELVDVGLLPTPQPGHAAVAGSLGYGYTEDVLAASEDHHRAGLSLAGSYALLRWLSVAMRFDARYDTQAGGPDDGDDGVLGATRLLARAGQAVTPSSWLGGELSLRFPPADDVALGFATLGFDLRALGTHALGPATALSASAGFRLDRSDNAVDGFERLSGADRLALGASQSNAVLLGVGAAHSWGAFTALGELGWDLLVGSAAPVATSSPMRIIFGARYALLRDLQLELLLGLSPSGRPALDAGAALVPVEPRVWLSSALAYSFFPGALPGTAGVTLASVRGRVVDQRGAPIAGASIAIGAQRTRSREDGAFALRGLPPGNATLTVSARGYSAENAALRLRAESSDLGEVALAAGIGALRGRVLDANGIAVQGARVSVNSAGRDASCDQHGGFEFDSLPAGTLELYVQAPQWEPIVVPVVVLPGQELQLDVVLREQLPLGQIRGTVRGAGGEPVLAEVAVEELQVREPTAVDGTFALDVLPGRYTVTVSAVGYERDQREVEVEHNGVTVLLIDLRGAR